MKEQEHRAPAAGSGDTDQRGRTAGRKSGVKVWRGKRMRKKKKRLSGVRSGIRVYGSMPEKNSAGQQSGSAWVLNAFSVFLLAAAWWNALLSVFSLDINISRTVAVRRSCCVIDRSESPAQKSRKEGGRLCFSPDRDPDRSGMGPRGSIFLSRQEKGQPERRQHSSRSRCLRCGLW